MSVFSRDPFNNRTKRLTGWFFDLPVWARVVASVLFLIALISVGWLVSAGLSAKSHLEQARSSADQVKAELLNGKSEDAIRWAENAQFHARQAHSATHSLPWNIGSAVPVLGSPLKTTRQISDVVVGLADNVLLPTAFMGGGVSPDRLIDGTRLNLAALQAEAPRLIELSAAAGKLDTQAQAISKPAFFSLIDEARSQLQDQTSKLTRLLANAALAAQLAPSMLGADGPRTYLMAFQNNAEARGTGGILGGFGILRFDNGTPTVDMLTQNTGLEEAVATVDLGPEFDRVYGWTNPYTDFRNSNLSPHFPYAAQIWKSMWENESGEAVDGVITVDPVALSYILGAIGPVTLPDGEIINQQNVVELTQSTAYSRFLPIDRAPDDGRSEADAARYNSAYAVNLRKKYLLQIAGAVANKLTQPLSSPRALLDALGRAASEQRIAVWSASPVDQELLDQTPLGHIIPDDNAPYAQVVVNNLAGNKMDYYLRREIEYAADGCDGDMRNSTITVRLSNVASVESLPDYVTGSKIEGLSPSLSRGTMVTSVRVIATKGARLIGVTSDGKRTTAIANTDRGHPSFEVQVAIPPGQSGELSFRLSEPASPGAPRVPIQPLIDDVTPRVRVPTCE